MATVPARGPVEQREGSLSGARADFVAQLGRRVSELRAGLQALEQDPSASRPRDELKRRFHALGSAARVLKFQALADELLRLEQVLLRVRPEEPLDEVRLASMRADVDMLISLAWGEAAPSVAPPSAEGPAARFSWPLTALVVGDALLAEGLLPEMSSVGDQMLECERVASTDEALEMTRALAPDVIVLDVELSGSQELMEQLSHDPLTEPVPVVAVGTFSSSERAARWVALGAARVLARPFSPRQLQEACSSVVQSVRQPPRPEPLGQLTLDQLVQRLQGELQRGLGEAALDQGRLLPVNFGDGHEVMAALWSALVRIREVATLRSSGLVRFQNTGPEGAVAVASWAGDARGSRGRRTEAPETPQRLDGRTVLVVDDDPSVTWFLSGVLRTAGATVLEAHDGEAALRLAQRHGPELVISDILMPKLDGFALCRALKRDVVLRDVPVILLSWKEDLLQRMRELGADADGYLRKEASAAVVLERVFEVLRPRLRVERRLLAGGEVRGRLDDLTVRTLLAQVARLQPSARVSVRDAAFYYEVELRGGVPRSATRTTPKGAFERGPGVIFNLLGVGAGRFVVTPSEGSLRGWLEGTLEEQLRPATAQIRAAQRLLSGAELLKAQAVEINLEALQPYFEASPTTSREILDRLAEGFSPRALLLRAGYPARLLEDVLNDAILHGGVTRVVGSRGEDLLPAAIEQELAVLELGQRKLPSPVPEAVLYAQFTPSPLQAMPVLEPVEMSSAPPEAELAVPQPKEPIEEPVDEPVRSSVAPSWSSKGATGPSPMEEALLGVSSEPPAVEKPIDLSLQLGTPLQASVEESLAALPSWKPLEGSVSPAKAAPVEAPVEEERGAMAEVVAVQEPALAREQTEEIQAGEIPRSEGDALSEAPESEESSLPLPPVQEAMDVSRETPMEPPARGADPVSRETSMLEPSPGPQMVTVEDPPITGTRGKRPWGWVVGVLGLASLGSLWVVRDPAPPRLEDASNGQETVSAMSSALAPLASASTEGEEQAEPARALGVEDLPLEPGTVVPEGQGLLEVQAGVRDELWMDRREVGRGPEVKLVLPPGTHELRSRRKGDEQPVTVVVRAGRRTKVDLRGPWRR